MKSFKDYLLEEPYWLKPKTYHIFSLRNSMMIPFSPSIWQRIFGKKVRAVFFHACSVAHLGDLIKLQRTKKSISASVNFFPENIQYGIQTYGGCCAKIEGTLLGAFSGDIMSKPDENGMRWVSLFSMSPFINTFPIDQAIMSLQKSLMEKYGVTNKGSWSNLGDNYPWDKEKIKKYDLIKDWFDGIEKILMKYSDNLRDAFFKLPKNRKINKECWDEAVINEIIIKEVLVLEREKQQYIEMGYYKKFKTVFVKSLDGPEAKKFVRDV